MTIDSLAIMTKDGFDGVYENMKDGFDRHGKVLEGILKEIKAIHEDNKYFRQSISSLNIDGSSYDRKIEDLTMRVEKLEKAK